MITLLYWKIRWIWIILHLYYSQVQADPKWYDLLSFGTPRLFSWAVWHSCRMGARNQEQTRGRIGPQLRLGNLRVGELHFCPLCTALDQASSLSRKLAYVPGPTFGFVKLLASSGSHCTKWADEQHRQAGFESRLLPDLPLPFIPTLIGLRAFDLVSSRVWWEAATNTWLVIIPSVGQMSLFKNDTYLIGPCAKKIFWNNFNVNNAII